MHTTFEVMVYGYIILGAWKFILSVMVKGRSVKETAKLINKNGLVWYE